MASFKSIFATFFLLQLCCTFSRAIDACDDGMSFENQMNLDFSGKFQIFWNAEETGITMEAQVETTGWVGLGFNTKAEMIGGDMIMAWVNVS